MTVVADVGTLALVLAQVVTLAKPICCLSTNTVFGSTATCTLGVLSVETWASCSPAAVLKSMP